MHLVPDHSHFRAGDVFCSNMHNHSLSGEIARKYTLGEDRFELDDSFGLDLYARLRPNKTLENKVSYVISNSGSAVLILYYHDTTWWIATAKKKPIKSEQ